VQAVCYDKWGNTNATKQWNSSAQLTIKSGRDDLYPLY
jgi:hypothetical protein